jgi:CRISPR-associated protein Csd2
MTAAAFTPDIPVTDGVTITDLITDPARRHDFMIIFEANNANPNGDPDTDNMPRTEPDQGRGLATDTSIKRKVRDIAALLGYPIFIQPSQTLNRSISEAFAAVGAPVPQVNLTEEELENEALLEHLAGLETFTLDDTTLMYAGDDPKKLKAELAKGVTANPDLKKMLDALAKRINTKDKGLTEKRDDARDHLVKTYYDIRMFGAVLTVGLNAGQVLGPITLTPARTVSPVTLIQLAITRNAKNTTARAETGATEMGRRHIVSHGLYVAYGHYDAPLGTRLGVSREDLQTLWYALTTSYTHTRSAARGDINVRGLYVFTHDHRLGNALSHKLFDRVQISPTSETPLSYADYTVSLPDPAGEPLPAGITFTPVTHG